MSRLLLPKDDLFKLIEALFSAGYETDTIKTIYSEKTKLRIARRPNIINLFSLRMPKDKFIKIAEVIASFNYAIYSLKTIREPGFRGIELKIGPIQQT